jgi:hypothetical protein
VTDPAFGHGSNVDLGAEAEEIKAELRRLSALMEDARATLAAASREIPGIRRDLAEQRDAAWRGLDAMGTVLARHGVTVARERVAADTRELRAQLDTAEEQRARGLAAVDSIKSQISATQTLANMWLRQWDEETGGRGRR